MANRNYFVIKTAVNGYIHATAKYVASMSATFREMTSDWISVEDQEKVTIQTWNDGNSESDQMPWIGYAFYTDKDMSANIGNRPAKYGGVGDTYLAYVNVSIPETAKYMRVSFRRLPDNGHCKVEFSDVATDYTLAIEDGGWRHE